MGIVYSTKEVVSHYLYITFNAMTGKYDIVLSAADINDIVVSEETIYSHTCMYVAKDYAMVWLKDYQSVYVNIMMENHDEYLDWIKSIEEAEQERKNWRYGQDKSNYYRNRDRRAK